MSYAGLEKIMPLFDPRRSGLECAPGELSVSPVKCSLLLVDDEPYILNTLSALAAKDFEVLKADSAETAIDIFRRREVDIILTDQKMPGMTGVQLLEWVHQNSPRTMRLVMTGLARLEDAVDAINCGQVHRYLFKPWRANELLQILRNSARTFLLERSHEQLLDELRQLNQGLEERVKQRTQELEEANRQLQQKNSMLEKLALTDPLTGIPNRRAMDRLVRSEQRRRARYRRPPGAGPDRRRPFQADQRPLLVARRRSRPGRPGANPGGLGALGGHAGTDRRRGIHGGGPGNHRRGCHDPGRAHPGGGGANPHRVP